ncbi:MAG TPA: Rid family detoxifying hydrolase [Armatimonadota bacterium]|nr:Rid family detoxifying hydrolase [Armatimonadota bacterium]
MSEKEVIISDELPAPQGPYSPAIRAGGFVFVSGQGPIDPATGEVVKRDVRQQTRLVLENIRVLLGAAGSSLDKVVKTNVYLSDIADFAAMNEVYATFFRSEPPARTTIQAAALPLGIDVEIDVIALGG